MPLVLPSWQVIFDAGQVDILKSVMHFFYFHPFSLGWFNQDCQPFKWVQWP